MFCDLFRSLQILERSPINSLKIAHVSHNLLAFFFSIAAKKMFITFMKRVSGIWLVVNYWLNKSINYSSTFSSIETKFT